MHKEDAIEKIRMGQVFYSTFKSEGFQQIFLGHLKAMLEKADKECHDFRLREDRGKYAIVKYNTLKKVIDLGDEIIRDMEDALDYCEDHNIKI
jgi:hypothetical protein